MASSGVAAFGTTLTVSGTTIAELTNISGPGISMDTVETTNHDSPSGYREFVAGLTDAGEFSVTGNLIASSTTVSDLIINGSQTARTYAITFPNNLAWSFSGFITNFDTTGAYDGKLEYTFSIKVSGAPTFS